MSTRDFDRFDSLDRLTVTKPSGSTLVVLLPVMHCDTCEQHRPHITTDHYCTCLACGRTQL